MRRSEGGGGGKNSLNVFGFNYEMVFELSLGIFEKKKRICKYFFNF